MSDTFLKELREAARVTPASPLKTRLQSAADEIQKLIEVLRNEPTRQNMIELNGAWANGERALRNWKSPPPPPAPTSNAQREQLAA